MPRAQAAKSCTRVALGGGRRAEHQRCHAQLADRREIRDRVVGKAPQHHRRGDMRGDGEQHGVAIGRGTRRGLGADQPAGAAAVVDHDGLAEFAPPWVPPSAAPRGRSTRRAGRGRSSGSAGPARIARAPGAPAICAATEGEHLPAVDHGVLPFVAGSLGRNPGGRERLRGGRARPSVARRLLDGGRRPRPVWQAVRPHHLLPPPRAAIARRADLPEPRPPCPNPIPRRSSPPCCPPPAFPSTPPGAPPLPRTCASRVRSPRR